MVALDDERMGQLGLAAQSLVLSLDEAAEATRGNPGGIHLGDGRVVHGWAIRAPGAITVRTSFSTA